MGSHVGNPVSKYYVKTNDIEYQATQRVQKNAIPYALCVLLRQICSSDSDYQKHR